MTVTAIIPVKNGSATLKRCLQQLRNQQFTGNLEVVVIDSGSTDDSLAIAKSFNAKIVSIKPEEFSHGTTRNLGVQNASGELIYFTVQDAFLETEHGLQQMISHFVDVDVVAVNGMQAIENRIENNPALWFNRATNPVAKKLVYTEGRFGQLIKKGQVAAASWDNVNAMYRKEILKKYPFASVNFAEDMLWARTALQQGRAIVYDPSIVVFHYHHLVFAYHYRTLLIVICTHFLEFDAKPEFPCFINYVLRRGYQILKKKKLGMGKKLYWIGHNFSQYSAHFAAVFNFYFVLCTKGKSGVENLLESNFKNVPQGKVK